MSGPANQVNIVTNKENRNLPRITGTHTPRGNKYAPS